MAYLENSPLATFHYSYPSVQALASFIDVTPNRFATDEGKAPHRDGWAGTSSYQGALDLLNKGWPEGLAKMVTARAKAAPLAVMIPSYAYDVAGAYPNVALACAGEPMNMWAPTEEERKTKPIVKVGINISASGSYDAQDFINYGAAILSYIDALESASNIRCEVWIMNYVKCNDGISTYLLEVKAKSPEEHLDLDRLAFMIANPAMLRRFVFCHKSRGPHYPASHLNSTYGRPIALPPRTDMLTLSGINTFAEPDDKILNSPHSIIAKLGPMLDAQLSALGHTPPSIVW